MPQNTLAKHTTQDMYSSRSHLWATGFANPKTSLRPPPPERSAGRRLSFPVWKAARRGVTPPAVLPGGRGRSREFLPTLGAVLQPGKAVGPEERAPRGSELRGKPVRCTFPGSGLRDLFGLRAGFRRRMLETPDEGSPSGPHPSQGVRADSSPHGAEEGSAWKWKAPL